MVKIKYKPSDKIVVIGNNSGNPSPLSHSFKNCTEVTIVRVNDDPAHGICYDVAQKGTGTMQWVHQDDLQKVDNKTDNKSMKLMKQAVFSTAKRLAQANNTVTTLEIKLELRKTHPAFHWIQNSKNGLTGVSEYMTELAQEGHFTYTDNGQYRVYSYITPTPSPRKTKMISKKPATKSSRTVLGKLPSINRKKALTLMQNNSGHFFTAVFIKQDGTERTINCQYLNDQNSPTGYVRVRESNKLKTGDNPIRQINLMTLRQLKIGGQNYKIRKN